MKSKQKGVASIELAIVLPLLLVIGFAITEFGRAIYTYNTLAKSVRGAARYLSVQNAGNGSGAWDTARKLIAYGNPSGSGSPLTPGLDSTNMSTMVSICDASNCAGSNQSQGINPTINTVTITITGYQFTPVIDLLGFTRFFTGGGDSITSITFSDISVTMRQAS